MWSQLFFTCWTPCGKPASVLKLQCVTEGKMTWSHVNTTVCLWGTLWQERYCTSLTLTEITWHKKACCESLKAWKIRAAAAPVHTTHVLIIQYCKWNKYNKQCKVHRNIQNSINTVYYTIHIYILYIVLNQTWLNMMVILVTVLCSGCYILLEEKATNGYNVSKCNCILCEGVCRLVHFYWEVCYRCYHVPESPLLLCQSTANWLFIHYMSQSSRWVYLCISLWEGKVQTIYKRINKRSKGKITQAQRQIEEGLEKEEGE